MKRIPTTYAYIRADVLNERSRYRDACHNWITLAYIRYAPNPTSVETFGWGANAILAQAQRLCIPLSWVAMLDLVIVNFLRLLLLSEKLHNRAPSSTELTSDIDRAHV